MNIDPTAHIPRPFIIEIGGRFVINPPKEHTEDEVTEAVIGDRDDATVFNLTESYLRCGDSYVMGRYTVEPRAYLPMSVYWLKERGMIQQCKNTGTQEEPKLETSNVL
jgi:hypothetical protein